MKARFTELFEKHIKAFPHEINKKFRKQLLFLLQDIRYPSLHAKKREELGDVWQARVNGDYRFYFQIRDGFYLILDISKHPK